MVVDFIYVLIAILREIKSSMATPGSYKKGHIVSEETKRKQSEIAKKTGRKPPSQLGYKHTDEAKKRLKNRNINLPIENSRLLKNRCISIFYQYRILQFKTKKGVNSFTVNPHKVWSR